jgi:hypothetical protein
VLRAILDDSTLPGVDRIRVYREELAELACELADPELTLDPFCAVACERLLSDTTASPLLNATLPPEDIRSRVRQIRVGFTQSEPGACEAHRSA